MPINKSLELERKIVCTEICIGLKNNKKKHILNLRRNIMEVEGRTTCIGILTINLSLTPPIRIQIPDRLTDINWYTDAVISLKHIS